MQGLPPLANRRLGEEPRTATMVNGDQKAHCIAIIDDDEAMRDAVEGLVRSVGHEAASFESADRFLVSQARSAVSCIVADIQMPGLSGLDLQHALVSQGDKTPIIFVTGLPREDVRRRSAEADSPWFLAKPFDGADLIKCIEDVLAATAGGRPR